MTKEKVTALVIVAFLIAGVNNTSAATQAKPGAKCTKAGITQTVAEKKYTCVKSGKKLVWNKGVITTKLLPTPTPTPTLSNIVFPDHNVGTGLCEEQKNINKLGVRAKSEYVKVTKKYLTLWEKYNISKPKSLREVDRTRRLR